MAQTLTPPTCMRCGPGFIQILDWTRAPLPEARFVCHGCNTTYLAYVPREWECPGGWIPGRPWSTNRPATGWAPPAPEAP